MLPAPMLALAAAASPAPQITAVPARPPLVYRNFLPAETNVYHGLSFVDLDGDGYADLFNNDTGRTWINQTPTGGTWLFLSGDVQTREAGYNYAAAFGDYNNDGLADMATAPHNSDDVLSDRLQVVPNDSGNNMTPFWDAPATLLLSASPNVPIPLADLEREYETNCWGDLDGDGRIDLFAPAYNGPNGTLGNLLLHNTPNGMVDVTTQGFLNPNACCYPDPACNDCRPEGSMMIDLDDDGDLDIYCNGAVYQNTSTATGPFAAELGPMETGIGRNTNLDEGALLCDVDMDGDFDLVVNYWAHPTNPPIGEVSKMLVWGNRGDGTFFDYAAGIGLPSVFVGADMAPNAPRTEGSLSRAFGLTLADWDGDGDQDLIGRGVFRRNLLVDTGDLRFQSIGRKITRTNFGQKDVIATFADWDHDGDLDSAMTDWQDRAYFFENTTFSPGDDVATRPYVRVRPLRDRAPDLETEFGAVVEVTVANASETIRRRQIVSSSAGYLNQSEYALTFGLQGTADPEIDISVDFPSRANRRRVRVDKHVNDVLGGIDLASHTSDGDREIDVLRNGDVMIGGMLHPATNPLSIGMFMAGADPISGLALQSISVGSNPMGLTGSTNQREYIGIEFQTGNVALAMREMIIDGILDGDTDSCSGTDANIVLWKMTATGADPVTGSLMEGPSQRRNRRLTIPTHVGLEVNTTYRLVAKVEAFRSSPILSNPTSGAIMNLRGLHFSATTDCSEIDVVNAVPDATKLYMTFRSSL